MRFTLALVSLSMLLASACSTGIQVESRTRELSSILEDIHSEAYTCSPRELAQARSHLTFAELELSQGDLGRAQEHLRYAEPLVEHARSASANPACGKVVIAMRLDSDDDGLLDDVDACPAQPETFNGIEDEDGCPEEDRDADGYLDPVDGCPDQPEDFDGDADSDGCPDIDYDNDRDGILDNDDRCPLQPEDVDGFEDEDGCPEADNDGDGLCERFVTELGIQADHPYCTGEDRCPNTPEDTDGFEDEDGCDDVDNDNDRILDIDDACRDEPETYNGIDDHDGCPEPDTEAHYDRDTGRIYAKKVFFDHDATTIQPASEPTLDAIAQILNSYPNMHIRIEGHTDNRGSWEYNLKLSKGRAESVRQALVDRGISELRMASVGFGEDRPIDINETEEGRQANRRVELHVTQE